MIVIKFFYLLFPLIKLTFVGETVCRILLIFVQVENLYQQAHSVTKELLKICNKKCTFTDIIQRNLRPL